MIKDNILNKLKEITSEEKIILENHEIDKNIYMDNTDNIINSNKIISGGKQITIRPHTRFVHFPQHSHDYVEIVYMCSGSTIHIINGDKIQLNEGELLFLCQSAIQEILPADYNDIAINFIVLPEFFNGILQLMGEDKTPLRQFIVNCLQNKNYNTGYLHFKVADILPIQNLLENLIWTLIYDTPNKRNINQITMGLLFLQLINHADKLSSHDADEQTIVKVLRYIEERYSDGTLCELAENLHYDISALSREIKKRTGKKYTELVQEKRLSQSCFLLKNTNLNIDEIACKIGYENFSFFYKIFKKKYSISPRDYRQFNR